MSIQIAKIVHSHSHIEYVARVHDTLDVAQPPAVTDYTLGRFVGIESTDQLIVGVIANSQLINPEYGNFGPRMSATPEANRLFSPDYLHDQGVLISILILGWLTLEGSNSVGVQQTPAIVLPVHAPVRLLTDNEARAFHHDEQGRLRLGYYSQMMRIGGQMAATLLLTIIEQLSRDASIAEQAQLKLLRKNLNWQQTFGGARR